MSPPPDDPNDDQRSHNVALNGVVFGWLVVCCVVLTSLNVRRLFEAMSARCLEIVALSTVLLLQITIVFGEPWYISRLMGLDGTSILGLSRQYHMHGWTDARVVLMASVVPSMASLCIPIRSCMMWLTSVTSVFSYSVAIIWLGSPEGNMAYQNLCLLLVLATTTFFSQRASERQERIIFCVPQEGKKQWDVRKDHESSSLRSIMSKSGEKQASSNNSSNQNTAHLTEEIFGGLDATSNEDIEKLRLTKLRQIAEIGMSEHWLISADTLRFQKDLAILGSGSFGLVMVADYHGVSVAVKIPHPASKRAWLRNLPELGNELRTLRRVRHPNIVLFHGACIVPDRGELALVLEHVSGDRLDVFVTTPCTDEVFESRLGIMSSICCALRYLHSLTPSIVHGDLKGSNVLVERGISSARAKLIDFGLSRVISGGMKPLGGTLTWMAPEIIILRPTPSASADVFSYGRMIYLVMVGKIPLSEWSKAELTAVIKKGGLPAILWPSKLPKRSKCQCLHDSCCAFEARHRPSMVKVHEDLLELAGIRPCDDDLLTWQVAINRVFEKSKTLCDTTPTPLPRRFSGQKKTPLPVVKESSDSGPTQTSSDLMHPALMETHHLSKQASLMALMRQWNFPIPRGACCSYHACLSELKTVRQMLMAGPCNKEFMAPASHANQCMSCLMVHCLERGACVHCRAGRITDLSSYTGVTSGLGSSSVLDAIDHQMVNL